VILCDIIVTVTHNDTVVQWIITNPPLCLTI